MRILHICLANYYLEGLGYQENILPMYHKKFGNEVVIFTAEHVFDSKDFECKNDVYVNNFGVSVKSIKSGRKYGYFSKYREYDNLYYEIEAIKPDIIFVHGGQFISLIDVIRYAKKHKDVKMYIDQHGDYYNTPVNTFRRRIAAGNCLCE